MSSNLNEKIINWHERANKEENDFFVKFIFDYLAFVASISKYYRDNLRDTDRNFIQNLKRDKNVKLTFLKKLDKITTQAIIDLLETRPIKNATRRDKWWDNDTNRSLDSQSIDDGKIRDPEDYVNMIEFIYRVRNNLFHGQKGPDIERDEILVKYGSFILNNLLEAIIEIKEIK